MIQREYQNLNNNGENKKLVKQLNMGSNMEDKMEQVILTAKTITIKYQIIQKD